MIGGVREAVRCVLHLVGRVDQRFRCLADRNDDVAYLVLHPVDADRNDLNLVTCVVNPYVPREVALCNGVDVCNQAG